MRTRITCGMSWSRCTAPQPRITRRRAVAQEAEGLVGGEDRQAGLVGGEPLPEPRLAVEEALDVALPQPHLVGDRLDDLVVDDLAVGARRRCRRRRPSPGIPSRGSLRSSGMVAVFLMAFGALPGSDAGSWRVRIPSSFRLARGERRLAPRPGRATVRRRGGAAARVNDAGRRSAGCSAGGYGLRPRGTARPRGRARRPGSPCSWPPRWPAPTSEAFICTTVSIWVMALLIWSMPELCSWLAAAISVMISATLDRADELVHGLAGLLDQARARLDARRPSSR